MLTLTARKHLETALVNALRIAPYQATEILDRYENSAELDYLASPLHGTKALICEANGTKPATAHLFRDLGKGFESIGILKLRDEDLSSWLWYNKGDATSTAREITDNLRRGIERTGPSDDEHWISAEIIGYQNNDDHVEFDLQITGVKSLAVGISFGRFYSDHFESNPRSLTNFLGNLLGCKVDLLVSRSNMRDPSRFDYRIVGIIPGGLISVNNDTLTSEEANAD